MGIMNKDKFLCSKKYHHPKYFRTFLIEEKFIYFRIFSYDLEIRESFKNDIPNALIRRQNLPLKKFGFFSNECPDPPGSRKWVGEWSVVRTAIDSENIHWSGSENSDR